MLRVVAVRSIGFVVSALACVLAASCGGRVTPTTATVPARGTAPPVAMAAASEPVPETARPSAVDWTTLDFRSDESALAAWRQLGLRGDAWEYELDKIPDEPALLQALALAQLRHANLDCKSQVTAGGCGEDPGVFDVSPSATWDDPCLQRQLALWSVAQLEWPDLAAEPDLVVRLVTRPADVDLATAVLESTVDMPTDLKLRLIIAAVGAGNEAAVGVALNYLPLDELRAVALTLHLEEAFALLVAEPDDATFRAAILDEQLAAATRIMLIDELVAAASASEAPLIDAEASALGTSLTGEQADQALRARGWKRRQRWPLAQDLVTILRTAESLTAAHAATALAVLGSPDPLRLLTPPRTPEELVRQLRLRYRRGESVASLLAPGGLEITEQVRTPRSLAPDRGTPGPGDATDDDDDGDGDPWLDTSQAQVAVGADSFLPFGEQLIEPDVVCRGVACRSNDATVITFDAVRRGSGYVLRGITRNDPGECTPPAEFLLRRGRR